MTAYVSYRIKKIKTPRKLIEEIDSAPNDPPRCPPAKIRISIRNQEKKQAPPVVIENKNSLLNSLPQARVGTSPPIKSLTIGGTSQGNFFFSKFSFVFKSDALFGEQSFLSLIS